LHKDAYGPVAQAATSEHRSILHSLVFTSSWADTSTTRDDSRKTGCLAASRGILRGVRRV
jgi:hypothetical protein